MNDFMYYVPVRLVFGTGKLNEIGKYAKQYGKKALIVTTGPFFKDNGLVDKIKKILLESQMQSELFWEVDPNPLSTQVDQGAEFAKKHGCDLIIGLGGGSAIDAAKGIAMSVGHNTSVWSFAAGCRADAMAPTEKTLPIIAITTTSGTGSHITPYSVITNPVTKQKPGIGSDFLYPKVAIVDPQLMVSMPGNITATTGFDVLAHAIEAYTSNMATPMTDLYCEQAFWLVGKYLRKAVKDGNNLEARAAMAWADTLAGFAIAVAVITLCHSIAHAVGGVCETVHGVTLAAMTPQTMRFSMNHRPEKFQKIGKLLRDDCTSGNISLEDSIYEVEQLIKDIGLDIPLHKQGVQEADLTAIAKGTLEYMAGGVDLDPRKASFDDIVEILKKSF